MGTGWIGRFYPVFVVAWLALIASGYLAMVGYSFRPGEPGRRVVRWPSESGLARDPGRFTVVMAVHPRCPCSGASLVELAEVVSRSGDRLRAYVFASGLGTATDPRDLATLTARLAGSGRVAVVDDPDGSKATAFGARTSGHVALYDPAGALIFSGGITGSRGRPGSNVGRDTVVALIEGRRPSRQSTPVLGCPIFDAPTPGVLLVAPLSLAP